MNRGILRLPTQYATMPRGLLGRPTPVPSIDATAGIHPEADAWRSNVLANGGRVSAETLLAVSRFCNDIDDANIRNRFYRLNLLCGTGLAACLVPLYRGQSATGSQLGTATDTNNNFVGGDYFETGILTGGLKGNGTSKSLNTGVNPVTIGASTNDFHLAIYARGVEATGTSRVYIGTAPFGPANETIIGFGLSGTSEQAAIANIGATRTLAPNVRRDGFNLVTCNNTRTMLYYVNGVASPSPALGQGAFDDSNITVFSAGSSFFTLAKFMRTYSVGLGLSVSQQASYRSAVERFNDSLERFV